MKPEEYLCQIIFNPLPDLEGLPRKKQGIRLNISGQYLLFFQPAKVADIHLEDHHGL